MLTYPFRSKLYFSLADIVSKAPGLLRVPQGDGKALQNQYIADQRQVDRQQNLAIWSALVACTLSIAVHDGAWSCLTA